MLPIVGSLSSNDPNIDYDWTAVLSVCLKLVAAFEAGVSEAEEEEEEEKKVGLDKFCDQKPVNIENGGQNVEKNAQGSVQKSSPSLRPLLATLYWVRHMTTLCLVSLLDADSMTESLATRLICRHFSSCNENPARVDEVSFTLISLKLFIINIYN